MSALIVRFTHWTRQVLNNFGLSEAELVYDCLSFGKSKQYGRTNALGFAGP
jgi:hypothetical protein